MSELKDRLSEYLQDVAQGADIVAGTGDVPIARIVGIPTKVNKTRPGCGTESGELLGRVDEPLMFDNSRPA